MRKVNFYSDKFKITKEGMFHRWFQCGSFGEDGCDIGAIIEHEDGSIEKNYYIEHMLFLDKEI